MTQMTNRFPEVAFRRDAAGRAIAEGACIGEDVYLGNNVTIYPEVNIGDRSVVMDGAVLGRVPLANRTTTRPVQSFYSQLSIGPDSIVGCNTVLYTGSQIGRNVLVADLSSIREQCTIGDGVVIGRGVMLLYGCKIGDFTRIQDQTHLVGGIIVEEHVFIGMGVVTTNDNEIYRSRFGIIPPSVHGPIIRKFAVVGSGATILPGVEIGVGAMVAAGATVTRDVTAWTVVSGVPARHAKDIPDDWRQRIEALEDTGDRRP